MGVKTDKIVLENTKAIEPINNGEITYNATLGKLRKKENGTVSDLDTNSGGGGGLTNTQIMARIRRS